MQDGTTVDFEVTFSDGTVQRVAARRVPDALLLWEAAGCRGLSPERAASLWALNKANCGPFAGVASIRRSTPPSGVPSDVPSDAALFFVREFASDDDWSRVAESANRVDEMRRATAHVRRKVADAAAYLLDGVRVRTVPVGVASGGAWSIEDAEDAIHAATWGRPLTGYVVGLGREMVVVLKQVPRCP